MKTCGLFPGQGNQYIGMGKDLYKKSSLIRQIYNSACEITNKNLKTISFEGPKEEQRKTENLQIITFLNSISLYLLSEKKFEYMVGHSIGEYSALFCANAINLENSIRIIDKRAELMSKISFEKPSLAAILGNKKEDVEKLCKSCSIEIALYNCPGNYVIGGLPENIEKFTNFLKEKKIKSVALQVSGPFHTSIYREIALEFKEFLENFEYNQPDSIIFANFNEQPYTKENIINNLSMQIFNPVKFEQSILKVPCTNFVEIGPGNSLSKMVSRIKPDAECIVINDSVGLEKSLL